MYTRGVSGIGHSIDGSSQRRISHVTEHPSTGEDESQPPNATAGGAMDRRRILLILFCVASAIAVTMFVFRAIQASRFNTFAFWFCGLAIFQLGSAIFAMWRLSRTRNAHVTPQSLRSASRVSLLLAALFIFNASMGLFIDLLDFLLVGATLVSMTGALVLLANILQSMRHREDISDHQDENSQFVPRLSEARVSRRMLIGNSIALGATGTMLGLWLALKPRVSFGDSGAMWTVAWSPDKRRLTSAGSTARVYVWDSATGARALTYTGHSAHHYDGVNSVAWSPDAQRIASAGEDGTARVWSAIDGGTLCIYRGHAAEVRSIAWSPDGKYIVSGSGDHTAQVWDSVTGATIVTYMYHQGTMSSVAWSPRGDRIATASDDRTVHVWNARTGQQLYVYRGHDDSVLAVAWSHDGNRLVSGSDDNTAQIWDARTGDHVLTYMGHDGGVTGLSWSPDGLRIASASFDGTAQVWDARTGAQQAAYHGHMAWLGLSDVHAVTWSPGGRLVASAGGDVQIWQP